MGGKSGAAYEDRTRLPHRTTCAWTCTRMVSQNPSRSTAW